MNTKKDRLKFVKEATDICFEQGVLRKVKSHHENWTTFENADLVVNIPDETDQKYVFSVFTRQKNMPFKLGNKYSGKHNFMSCDRVLEAAADFEDFIKDELKCLTIKN